MDGSEAQRCVAAGYTAKAAAPVAGAKAKRLGAVGVALMMPAMCVAQMTIPSQPRCNWVRFTSLTYAPDGRVTRREQRYVGMNTGAEIAPPEAAKEFPEVWEYRRVDQLPFYSLVKK